MRGNDQIAKMTDARFRKELSDRLAGDKRYNTFDLEDIENYIKLQVVHDPALADIKDVVLFADEKRRQMEDFRAWRRNKNDAFSLALTIALVVMCLLLSLSLFADLASLAPQAVTQVIKMVRKY